MTRLRRAIISLVLFLAILFNIERLDYSQQNLIDLHTFVYILVTTLIVGMIFFRSLQKLTSYMALGLWIGIYLVLKVSFFNRPLVGGMYTYLTITEMAMVAAAVLLTINLIHSLNELEGFAEKTIFPKRSRRVKDLHEAEDDIKTEFFRSRRHHRPLSVVVVEIDRNAVKKQAEQGLVKVQHLMMNRFVMASVGQVLTKAVRRTDYILEPEKQDGFILLCPETTADGADYLENRIRSLIQRDLGLTVQCGKAAFPDEAITFEDLLRKARLDVLEPGHRNEVAIAAPAVVNKPDESA